MIFKKRKALLVIAVASLLGISAATYENDRLFEIAKNLELFATAFKTLNTHYVDEIDPNVLMKTGIDAMVSSLDPYTNYFSESQIQSYRITDDEKFQGIGSEITGIGQGYYFKDILEGGPAQKAGIKSGDELIAIDGTKLNIKDEKEIMNALRGAAGSVVTVTVKDYITQQIKDFPLKRDEISIPNVPYSNIVSPNIGYVQLTTFTENAAANISKAVKKLKEENPELKGLMLDLRHNGGGLLREAISISNLFLPQGEEIVTTKGKLKDKDQSYKTFTAPLDLELPVVVLVDSKSASASEIVSGVLQDYDRAVIMGQRTYGKGLVQNIQELGYNSRLKVTISKYYIPSGRCIQGVEYANGEPVNIPDSKRSKFKTKNGREVLDGGGVTPDIKVPASEKSDLVKQLTAKNLIFSYANDYFKSNPVLPSGVESFKFTAYDDFLKFIDKNKFEYKIVGETQLDSLRAKLGENKELFSSSKTYLESLSSAMKNQKQKDLQVYKNEIINELEVEIASRYAYVKGKTQVRLRNDAEVSQAIDLLNNQSKFKSILKLK